MHISNETDEIWHIINHYALSYFIATDTVETNYPDNKWSRWPNASWIHGNFTHALAFSQLLVFQIFSIASVFYELLIEFAVVPGFIYSKCRGYYHILFFEGWIYVLTETYMVNVIFNKTLLNVKSLHPLSQIDTLALLPFMSLMTDWWVI